MITVTAGQSADVVLAPGQSVKISTTGEGLVKMIAGAPGAGFSSWRITPGKPADFGPYDDHVRLLMVGAIGTTAADDVTNYPGGTAFLTVSGQVGVGHVLTAWFHGGSGTVMWFRDDVEIDAAAGQTSYTQTGDDVGHTLSARCDDFVMESAPIFVTGGAVGGGGGSPALALIGTPILTATIDQPYAGFQLSATGGTPPYTFSDVADTLPDGIDVSPSTGAVAGSATGSAGLSPIIVLAVTDSANQSALLAAFRITKVASGGGSVAPDNTSAPTISGTAQVGSTLTSTTGSWTGSPTPTYARQWLRDGAAISGATAATYVPATGDIGSAISVRVTATNSAGSQVATSSATAAVTAAVVAAPVNTALPAITGTAQVGQTLTISNGTWSNSPTSYARQWKRAGADISGATGATYSPVTGDIGSTITCTVTATNGGGSAAATSAATAAVTAAPADSRARFGYGTATAGVSSPEALLASMTALTGSANGSKAGTFSTTVPSGQYCWVVVEATASAGGVTFTDSLGTGGWMGASYSGANADDENVSPCTSTVTAVIGGVSWRFFRQNYANASGSFTTS